MKEIKIVIPDGYEIDTEKSTPTNIVFKKISSELPQSWNDYCLRAQRNGYYIAENSEICSINDINRKNVYGDKNLLNTKEDAEAHLALMQLHQLRDCYRGGWEPTTEDLGWSIFIDEHDNAFLHKNNLMAKFLTFPNEDFALMFKLKFIDLIRTAKELLK